MEDESFHQSFHLGFLLKSYSYLQAVLAAGQACLCTWRIHINNPRLKQQMGAAEVSIATLSKAPPLREYHHGDENQQLQNLPSSLALMKCTGLQPSIPDISSSRAINQAHGKLTCEHLQEVSSWKQTRAPKPLRSLHLLVSMLYPLFVILSHQKGCTTLKTLCIETLLNPKPWEYASVCPGSKVAFVALLLLMLPVD